MLRPLGIFFLSRVALLAAIAVARPFLILPTPRPDPACLFGICQPNGWVPLALAALAMAAAVELLWVLVRRDAGEGAAGSAVLLFLASPLSLVLALDAAAAAATALCLFALVLAPRQAWAAGLSLAAAVALTPTAAWLVPAVVIAAWAADSRGMRVNALLVAVPVVLVLAAGAPLAAPWLQVESATHVPGAAGSLIHFAAIVIALGTCAIAFFTRRPVAGLAGAPWLAAGLALGAPMAAHLGAYAVAPWGAVAIAARKWELEAPLAAGLFMLQGLWLFHLAHGFRLA